MRKRGARLGQHFLRSAWAAKKLVEAARTGRGDTVLEIGPGRGALSKELLATGAHVIAVEKDPALVTKLQKTFAAEIASGQLKLIESDIRDLDPRSLQLEARSYAVAANIPYYITGEIIRRFLTAKRQPQRMALLVQKEVAERIVGKATGHGQQAKESILSLSVKAYGKPRIVAKVSRGNFSPPPAVDSAILVIEDISRDFFTSIDESAFFEIIRAGFASKRKFVVKNLGVRCQLSDVRTAFEACRIPESARAEDVPLEKWQCLVGQLIVKSKK